ncbi:unnamed protein product [Protopolystoma xenopodis]|uniref:Tetratricopeptide repeat protein 38 n=1 Tax=Protopolystoma xenopodis TaxID=117903 RepID=A0A3S5A5D1_9PLAT|nr:unnamed protein product [Protopolystoma xenopodis]
MPAGVRRWTDWERSHVQAAIAMAEGWTESAELAWEGLLKRAPQDLLSASSLFLSNLLSGQFTRLYANMDKAASGCRSSNPYYPYFLTRPPLHTGAVTPLISHLDNFSYLLLDATVMLVTSHGSRLNAFGGCEIGAYAAAEQDCAEAFTICPSDPMGAHAMAHLYEYTYRPDLGAELFASQREGSMFGSRRTEWLSCGPLYACHIAWHESMFYSALGDWSKALEIWDANIWPHCVLYKEDCSKRRVGRFELSDTAGLLFRPYQRPSGTRTMTVQRMISTSRPLHHIATSALESQGRCKFQGRPGIFP